MWAYCLIDSVTDPQSVKGFLNYVIVKNAKKLLSILICFVLTDLTEINLKEIAETQM